MSGETARPIGRAISTTVASAPRLFGAGGDFEADEAGADDGDLRSGLEPFADRGRVGDRAQAEDPRQIDAGRGEAPLPRARRQDQMAVVDHAPVPRFDALGGPVDPRRARAAPELDPVLGEERFGPQRQAEHVHLAFEKGLR